MLGDAGVVDQDIEMSPKLIQGLGHAGFDSCRVPASALIAIADPPAATISLRAVRGATAVDAAPLGLLRNQARARRCAAFGGGLLFSRVGADRIVLVFSSAQIDRRNDKPDPVQSI